ncbi:hypothetical protein [Phenylobacterium aquaticum]|uniref:hypothetical protein n=1 Tax=Phenylobacterium aquaticum TaxID=1763816 RepID=UPI0026EE252F|nr:hypothetical protein [Phenylobacterium aquaticum]
MDVVNGFRCRGATDREYAKQGIDPAKPEDGANGGNLKKQTEVVAKATADAIRLSAEATASREQAQARAQALLQAQTQSGGSTPPPAPPKDRVQAAGDVVNVSA